MAWTFFHSGAMEWEKGMPKVLEFAQRERSFCGDCGTPLMFFDPALPHIFEVSTCSLDHPENHPPKDQCWLMDGIPWSQTIGGLPKYDEYSPIPD